MKTSQKKHSPNVSIVMPVYNGAHTLMEAVESVLKQTYHDFELIICNDASTDETLNLLNKITDDRVRVIHNSNNLGEGTARDRAIETAQGFWLAFIDADDSWAPERLETLLYEAGTSEDKILFDDIWECHDTPSGMAPWRVLRGKHAFGGDGINSVEVSIEDYLCQKRLIKSALFPLKYVEKYNLRHGSRPFYADIEFFLKLLSHDLKLYFVPKPMYYYRITHGSMTGLTNRFLFMKDVLEDAVSYFGHAPDIQAALRKRAAMAVRLQHYWSFIMAKKRKEVLKALRILIQFPWIIPEYLRMRLKGVLYDVHRIWHRGRSRGIR